MPRKHEWKPVVCRARRNLEFGIEGEVFILQFLLKVLLSVCPCLNHSSCLNHICDFFPFLYFEHIGKIKESLLGNTHLAIFLESLKEKFVFLSSPSTRMLLSSGDYICVIITTIVDIVWSSMSIILLENQCLTNILQLHRTVRFRFCLDLFGHLP